MSATLWLLGAGAAGFVLAFLLLVGATRPADALEVPGVGELVQDPVGTVTKTVAPEPTPEAAKPAPAASTPQPAAPAPSTPKPAAPAPVADTVAKITPSNPLPNAADPIVETPGPPTASDSPTLLGPVGGAPGLDALPSITLPNADLGGIDTDDGLGLDLPAVDLGGVNAGGDNGLTLDLPAVDLGSVNAGGDNGLALALPAVDLGSVNAGGSDGLSLTLPAVDLGGVDTGGGGLTLPSIAPPTIGLGGDSTPPIDLLKPNVPDLGGAARRLTAPTGAPLPLNSDDAAVLGAGLSAPGNIGALEPMTRGTRASGSSASAGSTSAPLEGQPFDMPASPSNPSAPASSSGASGDGPTRTQTLVWNFAIVLAIAALALEASRRIALLNRLPQSQFLTLLIERPG